MSKPSNTELRDKYVTKKAAAVEKLSELRAHYDKFQTTYQPSTPLQLEVMDKGYRQLITEKEQQIKHYNLQIKKWNTLIEQQNGN